MTIQNKIIFLRDRANLTQDEVAKQLGISKSSYYRKEKSINSFTVEEFEKLLKLFNVTYDDFYDIQFPVTHEERIPSELLDNLDSAIDNSLPTDDWNENKTRYEKIQKALNSVLEERYKAFDFPEINLVDEISGTILKQVILDLRAESLIRKALYVQKQLTHSIFGANV